MEYRPIQPTDNSSRPVVFGEILFDCFADGHSVLGGAPFNVCWHLQGLGLSPLLISAVGDDPPGQRIRSAMDNWGLDATGLQTRPQPTGRVQVSLNHGEPSYDIIPDRAWDVIDATEARHAVDKLTAPLLYHGTLALRAHESRGALHTLRDGLGLPTLVDINLRPPWWHNGALSESLTQATWGKLNQQELRAASDCEELPSADLTTMAQTLRARHGLELLVVTKGSDGAMMITSDEVIHEPTTRVTDVVDTVGAGDAFSAVLIIGLLHDWPLQLTLRRALQFAACIVSQRGATANNPELYRQQLAGWEQDSQ